MRKMLFFVLIAAVLLSACQSDPTSEAPQVDVPVPPAQPTEDAAPPPAAAPTDTPQPAPTEAPAAVEPTQTSAAPAATGPSGDALEDVIAASRALREQKFFRVESELVYEDFPDMNQMTEIQVAPPDRMRVIGEDFELRLVEGRLFASDAGEWMELPIFGDMMENMIFMIADEEIEELRKNTRRAEYLGEEDLDGERTRVYRLEMYNEEMDSYGEVKLWIAVSDGLFRRFETVDPDEDGARVINTYKDYNVPLTIDLPE